MTVYFTTLTWCLPAWFVPLLQSLLSCWLHHNANMEHSVGLCPQAEGNKLQYLPLHL
jgi:hypothetical protein